MVVHTVQDYSSFHKGQNCAYKVTFFYQLRENYTDRMTPYGILFTHNVFPLQAL